MFTIAALAKRFSIPESTARFYCKRFRDFLPNVGQGKRRRYLPEALPVFETILQAMAENKNAELVEGILEKKHARLNAAPASLDDAVTREAITFADGSKRFEILFQRQTQALESIAAALTLLTQSTQQPDRNEQNIGAQFQHIENNIESIHKELKTLRSMQDAAETIHQQDLEQLRKWLAHLAKEQTRERGEN